MSAHTLRPSHARSAAGGQAVEHPGHQNVAFRHRIPHAADFFSLENAHFCYIPDFMPQSWSNVLVNHIGAGILSRTSHLHGCHAH
jgi:hypothetical protein